MTKLTQDLLKELFEYRDGNLYWRKSGKGRNFGIPAGTIHSAGYRSISINHKRYYTHRLIFLYHHGYLPEFLDHIDVNPANNDISNLREATQQENNRNQKKTKSINGKPTSSRFKGVWWDKAHEKWQVGITIGEERKYLGLFDSEIDAAEAYDQAAIEAYGEFARLNKVKSVWKFDKISITSLRPVYEDEDKSRNRCLGSIDFGFFYIMDIGLTLEREYDNRLTWSNAFGWSQFRFNLSEINNPHYKEVMNLARMIKEEMDRKKSMIIDFLDDPSTVPKIIRHPIQNL